VNGRQTLVYAQIGLGVALLVLSARSDGFFFLSRPGTAILLSTLVRDHKALCGDEHDHEDDNDDGPRDDAW
jgi:hypothetical protein